MRKAILLIALLINAAASLCQVNRSSQAVTVVDARLFAGLNFRPPSYADTTAANLNLGLDSCGAIIYTYLDDNYWQRSCIPVKHWKQIATGAGGVGPQGPPGNDGTNGATWRDGNGAPSAGLGVNGDYYFDRITADIYFKAAGSYSIIANIKGVAGSPGSNGTNGTNGSNGSPGSVWRNGSGAPSSGLGINGDYYLDGSTGNVYLKASGSYSITANIKGAAGNNGSNGTNGIDGINGDPGPPGADGIGFTWQGDFSAIISQNFAINDVVFYAGSSYICISDYSYSSLSDPTPDFDHAHWFIIASKGDQGIQGDPGNDGSNGTNGTNGSNGADGKTLLNGSGAPSGGLGSNGDFYIDNTAHAIYGPKTAGAWGSSTALVGPAGTNGTNGTNGSNGAAGSIWRDGSGAPSAGLGVNGDYYLDDATGNVYLKASGSYSIVANIKGAAGTNGSNGATGATGAAGGNDVIAAYTAMGSAIKAVPIGLSFANITTNTALVDGAVTMCGVYLSTAQTITGVKWFQAAIGSYTADNENRVGLYTFNPASPGTYTLVASSTNDGNLWQTCSTSNICSKAFTTPYSAAAGLYFIGALYNNSAQTTAPTIGSAPASSSGAMQRVDFPFNAALMQNFTGNNTLFTSITGGGTFITGHPIFALY